MALTASVQTAGNSETTIFTATSTVVVYVSLLFGSSVVVSKVSGGVNQDHLLDHESPSLSGASLASGDTLTLTCANGYGSVSLYVR